MKKICVFGSLAYDHIMDYPGKFSDNIMPHKIHSLNVSFLISDLKESFGGTSGNICYNLALLGEKPVMISSAGNNFQKYEKWLSPLSIDISNVRLVKEIGTAAAYIITDSADNQITAFYPGAINFPVPENEDVLRDIDLAIIAPGNQENMLGFSKLFKKLGIRYIFDPGQMTTALASLPEFKECIDGAYILIANDYEVSYILQKTGLTKKEILSQVNALITTLGDKGSLIQTKERNYEISAARPKNVSDPTGAGDAYRAGLMKGIVSGMGWEASGKLASVVSVYTVEMYGTQTHCFMLEDVKKRYEENYKEKLSI